MAVKKKTTKVKVKKTAPAASTRKRTTRSRSSEVTFVPFTFRRIVLITTCLVLFFFVFTLFAKGHGTQSVAGISVARGLFAQMSVQLPKIEGAVAYNIYYKETSETEFKNAVRAIPTTVDLYTISYLTKGTSYDYKIAALDENGEEFLWSEVKTVTDLQPM